MKRSTERLVTALDQDIDVENVTYEGKSKNTGAKKIKVEMCYPNTILDEIKLLKDQRIHLKPDQNSIVIVGTFYGQDYRIEVIHE